MVGRSEEPGVAAPPGGPERPDVAAPPGGPERPVPSPGPLSSEGRSLAALPKAHLHLHFTGSMRQSTLIEFAEEEGIRLGHQLTDDEPLRVAPDERGWFRFQRTYDMARRVVRSEAAMRRILREAVEDDAAEGSGRLELQIDPTSYAPFVGGITPALEIVLDEAASASRATGVSVGIIVATSRTKHPLDARTLARLAAKNAGPVVGFGLSNDERRGDTGDFAPAFGIAHRAGLLSVPHGGELLGPSHIREVQVALDPDRLGHGIRAVEDPHILERSIADGIAFEVCPESNVALGVYADESAVPLRPLFEAGAQIALGADDPLLFNSRLVDQYRIARDQGFSDAELAELARRSIRASSADDDVQRHLLGEVDEWLAGPGVGARDWTGPGPAAGRMS